MALNIQKKIKKLTIGKVIISFLLLLWTAVTLYPLIWTFFSSLKNNQEIVTNTFALPSSFSIENYISAWSGVSSNATLGTYLLNSVTVAAFSLLMLVFVSILAGYGLGRYNFKGKAMLNIIIAIEIAIPVQSIIVPEYILINSLGLTNSHFGLSIVEAATGAAMATILASAFFKDFPVEVEEAALIDGCGEVQKFIQIVLPMSKPVIATISIVSLINIWNDLLFPMILLTKGKYKTITQGLAYFVNEGGVDYGRSFAAVSISIIPVILLFLIFQKSIVAAITAGAIKG